MKRILSPHFLTKTLLGLAGCLGIASMQAASHSFFTPASITRDPVLELALNEYQMRNSENDNRFALFVKPFVMRSTRPEKLSRYFMIHNQQCATIRENGTGDINSLWLNLISPIGTFYSSNICFAPRRLAAGAVLTFYADLDAIACNWWAEVNTAILNAHHYMQLKECNSLEQGTIPGIATACDAFNNPDWCAGRITCCDDVHATGLDDIQLKLGYNLYMNECSHFALYGLVVIPTGRRITSQYLFEPVIGSKHARLGFGLNGDYVISQSAANTVALLADFKYSYGFSGTETRSFDLCRNGDWSRYLLVAREVDPTFSLPGINLFTFPVSVTPRSEVQLFAALHVEHCNWNFEVGYNFWYRQSEKICFGSSKNGCCVCSKLLPGQGTPLGIPAGYGIFDMTQLCASTAVSASTANISQGLVPPNVVVADPTFVQLTNSDLNFCSAAHPQAYSNKIYGAVGYDHDFGCHTALFGLGVSYEFANKNALDQWALWLNIGTDF